MADVVLSKKHELAITRCLLLGATHNYNDYGHPERAGHRKYHNYEGMGRYKWVKSWGITQARAAQHWLVLSGYNYNIRVAQVSKSV